MMKKRWKTGRMLALAVTAFLMTGISASIPTWADTKAQETQVESKTDERTKDQCQRFFFVLYDHF